METQLHTNPDDVEVDAESRFLSFFRKNSTVMLLINPDSAEIIEANPAACDFFGDREDVLKNRKITELDICAGEEMEVTDAPNDFRLCVRHCRKTGEINYLDIFVWPIILRGNCLTVVVVHDVVDRKRAEQVLAEAKEIHRRYFEVSPAQIWLTDSEGRFEYFNKNWLDYTGRTTQQENGDGWTAGIHPNDSAAFLKDFREAFSQAIPFETEFRLRRHDGEYRWFQNFGKPFCDEAGNFGGYVGYCLDRTEQHETGEILRKLSRAVEQSTSSIVVTDTEGGIEYANGSYTRMSGYGLEEIIGRNPMRQKVGTEMPDVFGASWETVKNGGEWRGELQMRKKGGEIYWEFAAFSPIVNNDEVITHYLAVKEDITARKDAEKELAKSRAELSEKHEELRKAYEQVARSQKELEQAYCELKATQARVVQQEKMASIGQLAAGVAHEINNPMGFISSNLRTLAKYTEKQKEFIEAQAEAIGSLADGDVVEALRNKRRALKIDHVLEDGGLLIAESLEGAERVRTIVQNLKSFSRVDEEAYSLIDINECVTSTVNIVWSELKYKVNLIKELGEIPRINCYPQQINQIFMNLLVNAAQAIETHGEIKVKTWEENGRICASVSDTGCGIPSELFNRIFEPFFTTKEVGQGTGLGLSITYDIVKNHDGELIVESEPGKGTTFTVRLPMAADEVSP